MISSERLQQIIAESRGVQLGGPQARVVEANGLGAGRVDNAQLVRFQGEAWEMQPWRVYLAPWQAQQGLEANAHDDAIVAEFAFFGGGPPGATAASTIPWKAVAEVALAGQLTCFAQVKWGSGGVQHVAYVDWPVAGKLFQVSGSYVEVNAMIVPRDFNSIGPDPTLETKLPALQATLAPEPGGGDSSRSATCSFPMQGDELTWDPAADPPMGINFPVPPFARSAFFVWDNAGAADDTVHYATEARISFLPPDEEGVGAIGEGTYLYGFTAGDIGDPREGVPIPAGCGYVRVEPRWTGTPDPALFTVGVTFELDL